MTLLAETFDYLPEFQPIPLPAPVWLLKILLVAGFYLHAIPMNVALTGGFIAALFILYARRRQHEYARRIGYALAFSLPFFVSVAITQGIVPLLFLQLVYGPLFYTSSILMALPWMMVIFVLLSAYYTYYTFTYRRESLGARGPFVLIGAGLLFMYIAFMFTNNTTLMLTPERWLSLYQDSPSGINLNWAEPQIYPRYIHFLVAAVAVTGLTIGTFGLYWHSRDREYGQWLIRTGAAIFLIFTLMQIPIGIWFMLALPHDVMWAFLGQETRGTAVFFASMVVDIIALGAMALAWKDGSPGPYKVGLAAALLVVLLMVVIRHFVRVYFTQGFFRPEMMPVDTQWELIIFFLISFVIGVAYTVWLIKVTWDAFHKEPPKVVPPQAF